MSYCETAYAKINLALHVRCARNDGYHEIETLFGFVDCGDVLTFKPAVMDSLNIVGEFSSALSSPNENLIMKLLADYPRLTPFEVTLEKNLPVSAGLGGGSADAGAALRILRRISSTPDDWENIARRLGADVPACVASKMLLGTGVGHDLGQVENDLEGMAVLLVNPRLSLSTQSVFGSWNGRDLGALPTGPASHIAQNGRNDLTDSALKICPEIEDVLRCLQRTDPWLSKMSGSGATCFALYENSKSRNEASQLVSRLKPHWWQKAGTLMK